MKAVLKALLLSWYSLVVELMLRDVSPRIPDRSAVTGVVGVTAGCIPTGKGFVRCGD